MPIDALVTGRACVDLVADPADATLETADRFTRLIGGFAANVAVALARLGATPAIASGVGDDANGRWLRTALEAEGVDCRALATHPTERTTVLFRDLGADGRPRVLVQRGETTADWEAGPAALATLGSVAPRLVFACGTMLARLPSHALLMAALATPDALRLLDLDFRPGLWADRRDYPVLAAEAVRLTDVVLGGAHELEAATEGGGANALLALGPTLVVEKRGADGVVLHRADAEPHTIAGHAAAPIDPQGAGDAFAATLGLAMTRGDAPVDAAILAVRAGAHVAARIGCAEVMPRIDDLAPGGQP